MKKEIKVLTTTPNKYNKIGFIFFVENEQHNDKGINLFIPTEDFDYIIDIFRQTFPLKDNEGDFQQNFEVCWENYFDKETCYKIIEKLAKIENENIQKCIIKDLIEWIKSQLWHNNWIIVEGNL